MLKNYIRVFFSDNGTLTDQSIPVSDGTGFVPAVTAAEDYLYVGQYFPFNNFFFDSATGNVSGSVISVDTWNGSEWCSGVDIMDATSIGGATFAQAGVVQFEPDHDESWNRINDTSLETGSGLESIKLYDMYWIRIGFSADPSASMSINTLFYAFCSNSQLTAINPDINEFLDKWESGKTNWNEQIMLASEHVVADLKERGLAKTNGQILRFDDVALATAYKTLSLISIPFGKAYEDKRKEYEKAYHRIMNSQRFTFDITNDGKVQLGEIQNTVARGVR